MVQITTILVGPSAGSRFIGPGSIREARSWAKGRGRRFVTKTIIEGRTSYGVWDEQGFLMALY